MIKRLVGLVVLFLMGFGVFVCLAGFGAIAFIFLTMHPAVVVIGTTVSSLMVLWYLLTKD